MAIQIALFNHKGGVSKTTTTFHLGWMLAEKGYRVVVVDADPQCNLSGLILGFKGDRDFEHFYTQEKERNIHAGLAPAFESQPRAIGAVECLPVEGRDGLYLLPGHIGLSEYEVTLGIAQELSATLQSEVASSQDTTSKVRSGLNSQRQELEAAIARITSIEARFIEESSSNSDSFLSLKRIISELEKKLSSPGDELREPPPQ